MSSNPNIGSRVRVHFFSNALSDALKLPPRREPLKLIRVLLLVAPAWKGLGLGLLGFSVKQEPRLCRVWCSWAVNLRTLASGLKQVC